MGVTRVRGIEIPTVGLGTWRLTGEQCRQTVRTAIDLGYKHVDTAQEYGNERQVGAGIRNSDVDREDLFVTTKLGRGNRGSDEVRCSIEESLTKLGTDYVDLLLIHWPGLRTPLSETLDAMNELVDAGRVRHIGVSNFDIDKLARARNHSTHEIVTNQVQYNPYWSQTELLDYCRIHDMALTAYSPLAHGGVLDDPILSEIGRRYEKTAAQVALRWLVQQSNVVTIPKATSREHLEANLTVSNFELTDAEMERIRQPSKPRAVVSFLKGRFRSVRDRCSL